MKLTPRGRKAAAGMAATAGREAGRAFTLAIGMARDLKQVAEAFLTLDRACGLDGTPNSRETWRQVAGHLATE